MLTLLGICIACRRGVTTMPPQEAITLGQVGEMGEIMHLFCIHCILYRTDLEGMQYAVMCSRRNR